MPESKKYHIPVLVNEVLEYLNPEDNKVYLDVTFGGGGHTREILLKAPSVKVIAIDWDRNALNINGEKLKEEFGDRLELAFGNFAYLGKVFRKLKVKKVDGVLADFGTSQYQIFQNPGLSVHRDDDLDMRLSPGFYKSTATDLINKASEKELFKIFTELGEERYAKLIVQKIAWSRKKKRITKTSELVNIIKSAMPKTVKFNNKKLHPATKVFQALRIYVNKELENINSFLMSVDKFLNNNARLVCISFHSLEDRLVKHFFKSNEKFKLLTSKAVTASEDELKENPSSRSAKLRAGVYSQ